METIKPDRLSHVLEQSFGLPSFREGQREIIEAVLQGQDVVAVMPTGGGKSLCYQLPALLLPGLTIVVSPLIALMKDQVDALQGKGLPATFINSSLTPEEQARRIVQASQGQIKLLYVAPERFRSMQFMRALAGIDVSLFSVDEAHCLSQWGHDFRPDYLRLGQAIASVGRPPIAAFTATATVEVREDIVRSLSMVEPAVFFAGVDRENLFLAVEEVGGRGGQEQKMQHLLRTIRKNRDATGIVYASTRKNVEKVYERLRGERVRARAYHAGMDDEVRAEVQDQFMSGRLQVIVATNAFGMGVDKADIRYVVHHDFPGSIEAYYQEVGRAGRDNKPARCLTLFSEADRFIQEFFHKGSNPPRETIEEVHKVLCRQDAETIELTVAEITGKLKTCDNDMAVTTALKVLERFGVISRGFRGEGRAWARAKGPWRDVMRALARAPVQRAVAESLPVVAAGDLNDGAEIDLGALAYEAGVDREAVSRVLLELERAGHLEYEPPFRGRSTRVLRREADLPVDWGMLEEKARRDYDKIESMIALARTTACRKWYLRRYFMGEGGDPFCRSCDNCGIHSQTEAIAAAEKATRLEARGARSRAAAGRSAGAVAAAKTPARPLEGDSLLLVQKVLSCVARMRGRFGRTKVAQVLKGSKDRDLIRWGLDQLTTYGLLADLKLEDIVAVVDVLLEAGMLRTRRVEEGATPRMEVVELSDLGREVMLGQQVVSLALPPGVMPSRPAPGSASRPSLASAFGSAGERNGAGGGADGASDEEEEDDGAPYSPRIYEAICAWRAKRARQASVPAYLILHNRTIRELAREKPTSPEALRRVKGMGPSRCREFGEDLLAIVLEQVRLDPDG